MDIPKSELMIHIQRQIIQPLRFVETKTFLHQMWDKSERFIHAKSETNIIQTK